MAVLRTAIRTWCRDERLARLSTEPANLPAVICAELADYR
jgi:hypothetical protein